MLMNRTLSNFIRLGCFATTLSLAASGQAQVTVSSNPANGATGVSPTATVVFTFSGPVDTNLTAATFFSIASPLTPLPVTSIWNSSSNRLSCAPSPSFPASQMIIWGVEGEDPDGGGVSGSGYFTTGTGGGSGGTGTNATTTFGVNKVYLWDQSPAGALTNLGCAFNANTILASNRSVTSITLTLPTLVVNNLTPVPQHPESNYFSASISSSNTFEANFPQGTNTFYVSAVTSNQTVQVVLPLGMAQPNPPYITNLVAAQSVNATQSFILGWQVFVGGTITDYVNVIITDTHGTNTFWKSPDPTTAGALNGTATSVTIPANTLQSGSNYLGYVGFYHFAGVSNAAYLSQASRITGTQFPLGAAAAIVPPPVVTNYIKSGSTSSFDVITTTGQALTVVYSTNCALPLAQWPILLSTNSPAPSVHITDPRPATNRVMLYRVRNGP
jgi:hypothetical protein